MTRGKRIAVVLGASGGLLALLAIAQQAGVGSGHRLLPAEAPAPVPRFTGLARESQKLPPFTEYGDIVARPVFNETRLPEAVPEAGATGEETAAATAPLNVTLTGVIMTPSMQLAFVRDNATNEVRRVVVGAPLEGEQSGWKLVELKARGAVFEGEGLGRQELELTTDTRGAAPSAPPATTPATPATAAPAPVTTDPNTTEAPPPANADEIRRRIEERRRQLREEAQRMMQEENKQ